MFFVGAFSLTLLFVATFASRSERIPSSPAHVLTISTESTRQSHFGIAVFIDDSINYSADGGLYAELIRNRAFQEEDDSSTGAAYWTKVGDASVRVTKEHPLSPQLPSSVVLFNSAKSSSFYGIRNAGFFGVAVQRQTYNVTFYARCDEENIVDMTTGLYDTSGTTPLAEVNFTILIEPTWKQYTVTIDCLVDDDGHNNTFGLGVMAGSPGTPTVQITLVSLFPTTWKETVARRDLAQALADIHPVYFRFPGLTALNTAEQPMWDNTVGPLTHRPGRTLRNVGRVSDGFGLNEAYRVFSEMGARPILQLSSPSSPLSNDSALQEYIDSVTKELHYLLDAAGTSELASKRTNDGQEQPWTLPYIQVGSESDRLSTSADMERRYSALASAISRVAPDAIIIFPFLATSLPAHSALDQHDYTLASNLISRWAERDTWPRNGTRWGELEYSVINSGLCPAGSDIYSDACRLVVPTLAGAIAEATFLMGLERNGDISFAAAYAPALARADHAQWTPALVLFDSLRLVKSTSYYVQQAFGQNRIKESHCVTSSQTLDPVFWSIGKTEAGLYSIKMSNVDDHEHAVHVCLDKGSFDPHSGTLWMISGDDAQAHNDMGMPNAIVPVLRPLTARDFEDNSLALTLPANAFVVATVGAHA